MKKLILIIFIFLFSNCSFDNKSGIWKNNNKVEQKKTDRFKDFETLYTKEKTFDKIIKPNKNLNLKLDPVKKNKKWSDVFYQKSNNSENFEFSNSNEVIFKSKKISRNKLNEKLLFDGNSIITSDVKGNIVVYSIGKKEIVFKYNFYKKKFKKIKKNLNIIIEGGIIYASDNLGYLYALDYKKKQLVWAKNFKIPFRSNIKISGTNIITADQNNTLYIINKLNGTQLKFIPTEETTIKSEFINSLALYKDSLIYLNTFGSLYSINNQNFQINWYLNFTQSFEHLAYQVYFIQILYFF